MFPGLKGLCHLKGTHLLVHLSGIFVQPLGYVLLKRCLKLAALPKILFFRWSSGEELACSFPTAAGFQFQFISVVEAGDCLYPNSDSYNSLCYLGSIAIKWRTIDKMSVKLSISSLPPNNPSANILPCSILIILIVAYHSGPSVLSLKTWRAWSNKMIPLASKAVWRLPVTLLPLVTKMVSRKEKKHRQTQKLWVTAKLPGGFFLEHKSLKCSHPVF